MGAIFKQAGRCPRSTAAGGIPVVFLPGWGFDGRICKLIRPGCDWFYPATALAPHDLLAALHELVIRLPHEQVRLVGWSLGANLALEFARHNPDRVASLTLVAMRRQWPAGELDQIRAELRQDPVRSLTTFYRKCFLGLPQAFQEFKLHFQDALISHADTGLLLAGLDYLRQADCRPAPGVATRIIHGRQDIISPVAEQAEIPGAEVEIVEHAGHLVFLSPSCSLQQETAKAHVRHGFSQSAATYDSHARLQQELAQRLANDLRLVTLERPVARVLEIGCGTGGFTGLLAERFPAAEILALDFSPQMVERARARLGNQPKVQLICADGEEYLRQAAAGPGPRFDLITSNATLQWFSDLPRALSHMAQLLPAGGMLHCCLFGPQTLAELGQGLGEVLGRQPQLAAGRFPDKQTMAECLGKLFPQGEIQEQIFQRSYHSSLELLRQLKATGATGWRTGAPIVLSRQRLARLDEWFTSNHGACRVGFQVFFLSCWKGQ